MGKLETKYIAVIIASIILGASILGHGYLDYKYKSDALEQKIKNEELARKDKEARQVQLQVCLDNVRYRQANAIDPSSNPVNVEGVKIIFEIGNQQKMNVLKNINNLHV